MTAKRPLSGSSSTPKSAWHFTVPPSPPTLVFLLFESLMMPWALPKSLRTTLFSWAEFMAEEPVKPKGRSRKAQPASTSLFDWALDMEKEREEELVGLSA